MSVARRRRVSALKREQRQGSDIWVTTFDEPSWGIWSLTALSALLLGLGCLIIWSIASPHLSTNLSLASSSSFNISPLPSNNAPDAQAIIIPVRVENKRCFLKLKAAFTTSEANKRKILKHYTPQIEDIIFNYFVNKKLSKNLEELVTTYTRENLARKINSALLADYLKSDNIVLGGYLLF